MKEKIDHNSHCLNCGKESRRAFCNRQCYLDYIRKNPADKSRKESEKKQRDTLTDRIIKRTIYINQNRIEKGSIKWDDITPQMIEAKRISILAHRQRRAEPGAIIEKAWYCKICGKKMDSYRVYCSKGCEKEWRRTETFQRSKAKKALKARPCKECGVVFIPEYGNKRRSFCSDKCLKRFNRLGKIKDRIRHGVEYERVIPLRVFARDNWRCQLCGKKLKSKDRGIIKDSAPELDHIIPLNNRGSHTYKNTQCACRSCNLKKGAKEIGQLRMF